MSFFASNKLTLKEEGDVAYLGGHLRAHGYDVELYSFSNLSTGAVRLPMASTTTPCGLRAST